MQLSKHLIYILYQKRKESQDMSNLTLYSITNRFAELMEKTENDELTEEEYNELLQDLTKELQKTLTNGCLKAIYLISAHQANL